jgi:hypothetical protein
MNIDNSDILKMLEIKLKTRTQTALAKEIGIKISYLNDVLHRRTQPGPAILDYLGFKRVSTIMEK